MEAVLLRWKFRTRSPSRPELDEWMVLASTSARAVLNAVFSAQAALRGPRYEGTCLEVFDQGRLIRRWRATAGTWRREAVRLRGQG